MTLTASAAIGSVYFLVLGRVNRNSDTDTEMYLSMRKWDQDNLDPQQRGFALKGLLANSSASTFFCNYNCDEDIFVKKATSESTSTGSAFSVVPIDTTSGVGNVTANVYLDQLSGLSEGIALWDPNPPKELYDKVSIGDVGYLHPSEGTFIRLFNVMLSWDDPLNHRLGTPEAYEPLDCGPFANIRRNQFGRIDYYSPSVFADTIVDRLQAMGPDE